MRTLTIAGLSMLMFGSAAVPASAAPLERHRVQHPVDEVVTDFCGELTVHVVGQETATILVNRRGRDGLVYFMENVHSKFTLTNLANGKALTNQGDFTAKDLKVTDNGDGTLTILGLATGGAKWFGPDGKLLFRDPGQIRFELLIDHNGTPSDPSDDEELDFRVVRESTGLNETQGLDFCEDIILPHIG